MIAELLNSEMNGTKTKRKWQDVIELIHEALGIRKLIPLYISDVFIDVRGVYFWHEG